MKEREGERERGRERGERKREGGGMNNNETFVVFTYCCVNE